MYNIAGNVIKIYLAEIYIIIIFFWEVCDSQRIYIKFIKYYKNFIKKGGEVVIVKLISKRYNKFMDFDK